MSEWTLSEHDGSQDITPQQRNRARLTAANWVRRTIPQRWNDSVEELTEILGMLGLLPTQEEKLPHRAKLIDCGPIIKSPKRSKTSNRHPM
jgi:hypothetical protein